tara:strand:+ start:4191 stop:4733 length:543 start_codon:yes stop_codon:yes gene_type:complete
MCGTESTSSSIERATGVDTFSRTRPAAGATPTGLGHTDLSRKEAFNIALNPFADSKLQSPAEKALAVTQAAVPGGFIVGGARAIGLMGNGLGTRGKAPPPSTSGGDRPFGDGEAPPSRASTPPSKASRSSAKTQSRVASAVAPAKTKLGKPKSDRSSTLLTGGRGLLDRANVSRKTLLGA